MPIEIDGVLKPISNLEDIPDQPGLKACPLTNDGVAFLFDVSEGEKEYPVKPTAALKNVDDTYIYFFVFETLANPDMVRGLAQTLGMHSLDECVPLPSPGGWKLVFADAAHIFASPDEMHFGVVMYGDAVVKSPYNEADHAQPITITFGANAESKNWKPRTMPRGQFIAQLCKHVEGTKDGPAYVLADMVPGQRLKTAVKAQTGVGLDIDNGTSAAQIDKALLELGCLAARYTTHSNNKTSTEIKKDKIFKFINDNGPGRTLEEDDTIRWYLREAEGWDPAIVATAEFVGTDHTKNGIVVCIKHAPMPKNRVILLFAEPFDMATVAPTQKEAMEQWKKVPQALADKLGIPLDKSGTDPSRMFYLPRHPKGRKGDIALVGGPLFDWRTLGLDDPLEKLVAEFDKGGKGKSKSKTPEGKELGRWSIKRSHGFQIADVIEENAPDRIRSRSGDKAEIECPYDDLHSDAGNPEDRACFVVNAGTGSSEIFTISCRHDSCNDFTNLDMLGRMIKEGWFGKEVLEDENYNAIIDDNESDADQTDKLVASLSTDVSNAPSALRAIFDSLANEGPDTVRKNDIFARIVRLSLMGKRDCDKAFGEAVARRVANQDEPENKQEGSLCEILSKKLGRPFALPEVYGESLTLVMHNGRPRISRKTKEGPMPLCTPFSLAGGYTLVDRGGDVVRRVDVFNANDEWVPVDIPASWFARSKGAEALALLMARDLSAGEDGRQLIAEYLSLEQPKTQKLYHRPGYRDGSFILPSGMALFSKLGPQLAREALLDCAAQSGSFEEWKKANHHLFTLDGAVPQKTCVLTGLAGSLADICGDDAFMVSLEGPTKAGKSANQAHSVAHWCLPKIGVGRYLSGNGTINSDEIDLEKGSGTITAYDEVSDKMAKALQALAFMVQQGNGKRRMKKDGEARSTRRWGGQSVVVSAENGFAARIASEGGVQAGGLSARCLPVLFSQETMISDNDWQRVAPMADNYGWSGPFFVSSLKELGYIEKPQRISELVERYVKKLRDTQGKENMQRRKAARAIGYIGAVAHICVENGLLPKGYDATELCEHLWEDALSSDMAPVDPAQKAIAILFENLIAHKGGHIVPYGEDHRYKEMWGCYRKPPESWDVALRKNVKEPGGEGFFIIRASKIEELAGGGMISQKLILAALHRAGHIIRPTNKDQNVWNNYPGLGKVQCVVIKASSVEGGAEDEAAPSEDTE